MGAPRVDALVALMALQTARLPARTDSAGDLVLLEEQDRGLWDDELIALGFYYLIGRLQARRFRSGMPRLRLRRLTPMPRARRQLIGRRFLNTTINC